MNSTIDTLSTNISKMESYHGRPMPIAEEVGAGGSMSLLYMLLLTPLFLMLLALVSMFSGQDRNKFTWKAGPRLKFLRINAAVNPAKKHVLITGCDRGLGYEIAKRLDAYGFSVIAGCLDVNGENVQKLKQETSSNLKTVQLNVTKSEDLDNVRTWMSEHMDGELWGVVNNAGVCFIGTPEIMAQQDINNVISVNLIGTINVTTKFQSLIRRSRGRIVNMGSLNGEVPMPFFSLYNTTKAGVKMYTESLAYELKDWGVKVCLVAPAGFKTAIIMYDKMACANKWWAEASEEVRKDYGKEYFTMPMRVSDRITVSDNFKLVTDSVLDALTSGSPRSVYRAGVGSALLPALYKYAPSWVKSYLCGTKLNFISGTPAALQPKSGDQC